MKPNSCLYRAVRDVVKSQFGIQDLKSDVFDKYNNGDGVPGNIMVSVINEALSKYGIEVSVVYGNIKDSHDFSGKNLIVRNPSFVPSPCIAYYHDHVEAVLGNQRVSALMAITLRRS